MKEAGALVSACFVYQNYGRAWEIAGVYTTPENRGKGLARKTVSAALVHLLAHKLIPRYQVKWDNRASISVARACGLVEFLRVNHYVVQTPRGGGAGT